MNAFSSLSRRYASVWFRRLSTDRIARRYAARSQGLTSPLVVAGARRGALCLVAVDDAAAELGLFPGMTLADARSRQPHIGVATEDGEADMRLLEGIIESCRRWTPLVAPDPPDGIFLDIAGCAHLFGGEANLLADLRARMNRQGLQVRAAVAATAGAAYALARYGEEMILAAGEEREALASLPLVALRIDGEVAAALARVGLKRIGDLYNLPRAPLAARFGQSLLDQLDRALGKLEEPISPRNEVAPYIAERPFAEPIGREEDVLRAIRVLATRLAGMLERRGEGARRLQLSLFRADGAVFKVDAATSRATRDAAAIAMLFVERLAVLHDEIDPGFGYDLVRLSVIAAERAEPGQQDFAGGDQAMELARALDRIGARIGLDRITQQQPRESHIPERAIEAVPVSGSGNGSAGWLAADVAPARPLRLLARPEPIEAIAAVPDGPPVRFRWRRALHEVIRAEGPERIAAEWWREACERPTRDYYRVEDSHGRRFWLYRDGLYGRETAEPRWFLHGTFA